MSRLLLDCVTVFHKIITPAYLLYKGPLSGTTLVSRYQKGKTNLDFTEARDSEWQWHQLGHMQVCTSLQTGITTPAPHHSVFTGRMPFLPPNQQCQSSEGIVYHNITITIQHNNKLSPGGETICPRRWQFDSRRIYIRPRTGLQSARG